MSTDQCLWCRYSQDGELMSVIEIYGDDFLMCVTDGVIGEKCKSEIQMLYRWDLGKHLNLNLLESKCDNSVTFSIVDLEEYTNKFIT